jgi:hypothetical protein
MKGCEIVPDAVPGEAISGGIVWIINCITKGSLVPAALVAVKVTSLPTLVVGVPEITPVEELKESPLGS